MLLTEQIIQENIQYITEMLSVSDDVLAITKEISNLIAKNYRHYNKEESKSGMEEFSGHETYNLMGYTFGIDVKVYNYKQKGLLDKEKPILINNFDGEKQTLTITIVMENGFPYYEYSDALINHEVLHMYQWCKNKVNNPRFKNLTDDAFQHSIEVISKSDDPDEYNLASLMYYSNPREQDAFVHEYYEEAKQSRNAFDKGTTTVEARKNFFKKLIRWLEENYDDPDLQPYLEDYRKLGFTLENIFSYARIGLRRFIKKIGKVKARLLGEFNTRAPFGEGILNDLAEYFENLKV